MKTKLIILAMCLMVVSGCAQLTPRQRYMVASDIFIGTVETLTTLKLNESQVKDSIIYAEFGRENLRAWKDALKAGNDAPAAIELFYINLGKLLELKKEVGNEP